MSEQPLRLRLRVLRVWHVDTADGFRVGAATGGHAGDRWPVTVVWLGMWLITVVAFMSKQSGYGTARAAITVVVASAIALVGFAYLFWGKVEVACTGDAGILFVGVWRFGWRRRFGAGSVQNITVNSKCGGLLCHECIELNAARTHRFGRFLSREQRSLVALLLGQHFEPNQ